MKAEYIDIICDNLREVLIHAVDAKSGLPDRCTFIFEYPDSSVMKGFPLKCGDEEE